MVSTERALSDAWIQVLVEFDIDAERSIILGGPLAERFGSTVPFAVVDEVAGLVSLGSGPILDAEASVLDARLPDDSVDAVVLVDAWRSPSELRSVVAEARRVCKPEGRVSLAALDVERLVHATPSMRPSALFYAVSGPALGLERRLESSVAATDLALQRAGFSNVESWPAELPVAAFATQDDYVAAVQAGMWPGVELITGSEWAALEEGIRRALSAQEPPYVERQPWLIASGDSPS